LLKKEKSILRNLFLDKPANLSSVFVPGDQLYTFEAALAVDGIYETKKAFIQWHTVK